MADLADLAIKVPSTLTPRVQEMHIAIGHGLCEIVEQRLTAHLI
jgi:D-sedoheptulose 7-phosphate isomerase